MKTYIVFFALIPHLLFSTEMGRIKGRIVDKHTGEPLVGVNVIVEGTEFGAATDEHGEYLISFVRVGKCAVTASYIGFNPVTQQGVVVMSGQTAVVHFKLEPTTITVSPVIITAEKPMVVKTQTQTRKTITTEDIGRLPLTQINEIISLQAGVTESELGTHVRGGRSDEIVYYVDGIMTKVPHYGQQSVKIHREAVEEIGVVTGGFDAEYGEALSGVVNIITREGGQRTHGLLRYTTDEIFASDKLNYGYNLYEFSLGGGVLQMSRLRYFFSGEAVLTDAHEEARYRVPSERFDYKVSGKLSYSLPRAKGKVMLSGFSSREQYMLYRDIWDELSFVFNLDHNVAYIRKNNMITLTFNYLPTENSLIEALFGYSRFTRFRAVRDLAEEERQGRRWYQDYILKAHHFPGILPDIEVDTLLKNYLVDSLADPSMSYHYELMERGTVASLRNNPFGATGLFYTVGDNRLWRYAYNRDYQGVLTFTKNIGKIHEVKIGTKLLSQETRWYDNNLPFYTRAFWDFYEKNPLKVAAYMQDVMDFEGIIGRFGVRLDYFDSKARGLQNPSDQSDSTMIEVTPKWRISPRLGFSLPITDRSKMRFNYGHFFQTPTANQLYRATEPVAVWLLLRRWNSVLGNPDLTVKKTVAYELGYENQLSDVFAFALVTYYKDVYDMVQTRQIDAAPYNYYMVFNVDYGNIKGLELILKKRLRDFWRFDFSYTLQFAKGTASSAWQHYYEIYTEENYDPETGEYPLPVIDYWLDFDERHILNSTVGFVLSEDFALLLVRDFSADFIISYHSGLPYTPTDTRGKKLGDENSARMPGYVNVDAKFIKGFPFLGTKLTFFADIYNLFNTEQIIKVYTATGKPDDNGKSGSIDPSDFRFIGLNSDYYTPQADYNHDGLNSPDELANEYLLAHQYYYNNPSHWKPGFRARFGVALRF